MKMMKIKIAIGTILFLLLGLVLTSLYSFNIFGVANPFSTAAGLIKITFTDAEYAKIQAYPQVIVAKPATYPDHYMEDQGFLRDDEKQMGALLVYSNGCTEEYILYSQNRYFSKWRWPE